jgi:hypothetical protein
MFNDLGTHKSLVPISLHKKAKHMVLFVAIQNAQNMVIILPKED